MNRELEDLKFAARPGQLVRSTGYMISETYAWTQAVKGERVNRSAAVLLVVGGSVVLLKHADSTEVWLAVFVLWLLGCLGIGVNQAPARRPAESDEPEEDETEQAEQEEYGSYLDDPAEEDHDAGEWDPYDADEAAEDTADRDAKVEQLWSFVEHEVATVMYKRRLGQT
ncbi:hypothetical protein ACWD4N_47115, partial [Streptomyces sp. NPDC002586]